MQLLCASVMLAGLSAAKGDLSHVDLGAISPASLAALAYLVVFGSIVAFTAYGWLLNNVGTQLLSTYAYVNPAVAVLLGWAFIGERIGGKEIAAGLVILASVAMLFFAREPRAAEPTPESLEPYIRGQEAQAARIASTPDLAQLRRIPA
jgi:drug/metabolite transporter (DMT)-like permease